MTLEREADKGSPLKKNGGICFRFVSILVS